MLPPGLGGRHAMGKTPAHFLEGRPITANMQVQEHYPHCTACPHRFNQLGDSMVGGIVYRALTTIQEIMPLA